MERRTFSFGLFPKNLIYSYNNMTETIDKNKELIELLLNTDNRDLAKRVLKELHERGENTDLLETLLQSYS